MRKRVYDEDPHLSGQAVRLREINVLATQVANANPGGLMVTDARPPEYSDESLALRFSVIHGDGARYVALWGQWLFWENGPKWKRDTTLKVFSFSRALCRVASAEITDPKGAKLAAAIASASTVAAVVTLARADRRHAMDVDQWDPDPWLLIAKEPGNDSD